MEMTTVLLIDDDRSITDSIQMCLEEEGYDVKTYSNASNILTKIKTSKPDVLLIDYQLPGPSGAEATKILRKRKNTRELPVIMIAANKYIKQEAKAVGVDEFIEKPFDLYELLDVIKRYTHN